MSIAFAEVLRPDTSAKPCGPEVVGTASNFIYPLKASRNNRYLTDQNGAPFLMIGDAPQTLIANLSEADASKYMANRRKYGINALWINLLCNYFDGCDKEAKTFDGIPPFVVGGDLSTPNPAYFERADSIINLATANGMTVLLDPIETGSWLNILRANGISKATEYGRFLGNRYKDFPHIIWMHGNDFQSWHNVHDDQLVQAVARGIRSADPNHIHTVELNFLTSGSLDDPTWAPLVELNAAYTYFPTYAQVLAEYNRPGFKPVFMVEANYEFEHLFNTDGGSVQNLRRQEYWAMLSGATGQIYGSFYTWRFPNGWSANLDTPGISQLQRMRDLFISRRWYDLIPDQTHEVVTSGYGRLSGSIGRLLVRFSNHSRLLDRMLSVIRRHTTVGSISTDTYAAAARTPDGCLTIAYIPSVRTITVDMSKLAGRAIGRWYDPTDGRYLEASGSPFNNSGSRDFTPPGTNGSGDGDWVLVLEVSAAN